MRRRTAWNGLPDTAPSEWMVSEHSERCARATVARNQERRICCACQECVARSFCSRTPWRARCLAPPAFPWPITHGAGVMSGLGLGQATIGACCRSLSRGAKGAFVGFFGLAGGGRGGCGVGERCFCGCLWGCRVLAVRAVRPVCQAPKRVPAHPSRPMTARSFACRLRIRAPPGGCTLPRLKNGERRPAPGTSADAMRYTFWLCTCTPLLPGNSSCSGLSLSRSRHRPRASRLFVIHVAHVPHRAGRPMSETPSPALSPPASGNLRGIVAMLAAMFFFSLMDAMLKALSASYPAMQVAALRGWTALPLVGLYVLWGGEWHRLLQVRWLLHLLRGGLTVAMLALFAYALRELALAEAYTLFFISPLLITALSTWVLREQVRAAHWAAIALGMVGVLVALRPSQEAFFTLGALAVLASAVCYAVSAIAGRMLTRTDPSSSLVFWTTTML